MAENLFAVNEEKTRFSLALHLHNSTVNFFESDWSEGIDSFLISFSVTARHYLTSTEGVSGVCTLKLSVSFRMSFEESSGWRSQSLHFPGSR